MSDMVDVINRLESWVRNYGHEKQPAFIADLRALIGATKAAQRAAKMLEGAQRYSLEPVGNYMGEAMMSNDYGDWLEFDYIAKVIQILQGECSE